MDDPFAVDFAVLCELQDAPSNKRFSNLQLVWMLADGSERTTKPEYVSDDENWQAIQEWTEQELSDHGYVPVVIHETDQTVRWRLLVRL